MLADVAAQSAIGCNPLNANTRSTLYLFGAYGIGKERVYMSVAERLNCKYVDIKTSYSIVFKSFFIFAELC